MKEKQQKVNIPEEFEKLQAAGQTHTRNLFEADDFSVDLRVSNVLENRRVHICGKDEFVFVLEGELDAVVEGVVTPLKRGDAFMVKAGIKHVIQPHVGAKWILVTNPHKHFHPEDEAEKA